MLIVIIKRFSQKVQGMKSCSGSNISYYIKYIPTNALICY